MEVTQSDFILFNPSEHSWAVLWASRSRKLQREEVSRLRHQFQRVFSKVGPCVTALHRGQTLIRAWMMALPCFHTIVLLLWFRFSTQCWIFPRVLFSRGGMPPRCRQTHRVLWSVVLVYDILNKWRTLNLWHLLCKIPPLWFFFPFNVVKALLLVSSEVVHLSYKSLHWIGST